MTIELLSGDQAPDLAKEVVDLAVRFDRPSSPKVHAARIGQLQMSVFAARREAAAYT